MKQQLLPFTLLTALVVLSCVVFGQTSTSTVTGLFLANFGVGFGNSNGTIPFVQMDSESLNVLNCGDGTIGHTNCILNVGVLNASSNVQALGVFPTAEIKTLYGGNNDTAGVLQLSTGGTAGYTFGQAYNATYFPSCVATDLTAAAAVTLAISNTGFTAHGTASHYMSYICIGRT
jgi:hypothetical protein